MFVARICAVAATLVVSLLAVSSALAGPEFSRATGVEAGDFAAEWCVGSVGQCSFAPGGDAGWSALLDPESAPYDVYADQTYGVSVLTKSGSVMVGADKGTSRYSPPTDVVGRRMRFVGSVSSPLAGDLSCSLTTDTSASSPQVAGNQPVDITVDAGASGPRFLWMGLTTTNVGVAPGQSILGVHGCRQSQNDRVSMILVDTSDPVVTSFGAAPEDRWYTSGDALSFQVTARDSGSGLDQLTALGASGVLATSQVCAPATVTPCTTGERSLDVVVTLSDANAVQGTNAVSFSAADYGGRSSAVVVCETCSFRYDSQAPTQPAQVRDGTGADVDYTSSTDTLTMNWDAGTDEGSGVSGYEWCVTLAPASSCTLALQSGTALGTSATANITLTEGTTYVACVRSVDAVGLRSGYTCSDGVTADHTAPTIGSIVLLESSPFLHAPASADARLFYNSSADSRVAGAHFAVRVDASDNTALDSTTFDAVSGLGSGSQVAAGPATKSGSSPYQSDSTDTPQLYSFGNGPYAATQGTLATRDKAGNTTSASYQLIADPDAPSTPVVSAPQGISDWHCPSGSETVSAAGSTDAGSGLDRYQYTSDGTTWQDGSQQTFSASTQGEFSVSFRSIDHVGNTSSASTPTVVRIDCSDPTASLLSIVKGDNPQYQHIVADRIYFNASATASGNFTVNIDANDTVSGIDHVEFPATGTSWTPQTATLDSASPYAQLYTWSGAANDPGTVFATARDRANHTATVPFTISADATSPDGSKTTVTSGTTMGSNKVVNSQSADVTITPGSDAGSGVARWQLYYTTALYSNGECGEFSGGGTAMPTATTRPAGYTGPVATVVSGTDTAEVSTTVSEMTSTTCYKFAVSATDAVANVEPLDFGVTALIADPEPPTQTLAITPTSTEAWVVSAGPRLCYNPATVATRTFTVQSAAQDNVRVQRVNFPTVGGGVAGGGLDDTAAPYEGSYTFATSPTASGSWNVTVFDDAGNQSAAAFELVQDAQAPGQPGAATAGSYDLAASRWSATSVTITSGTATDAGCAGVAAIQYQLNGGAWTATADRSLTLTTNGTHTVSFRAVDRVGNIGAPTQQYTVRIDTDKPSAPGVPAIVQSSTPGGCVGAAGGCGGSSGGYGQMSNDPNLTTWTWSAGTDATSGISHYVYRDCLSGRMRSDKAGAGIQSYDTVPGGEDQCGPPDDRGVVDDSAARINQIDARQIHNCGTLCENLDISTQVAAVDHAGNVGPYSGFGKGGTGFQIGVQMKTSPCIYESGLCAAWQTDRPDTYPGTWVNNATAPAISTSADAHHGNSVLVLGPKENHAGAHYAFSKAASNNFCQTRFWVRESSSAYSPFYAWGQQLNATTTPSNVITNTVEAVQLDSFGGTGYWQRRELYWNMTGLPSVNSRTAMEFYIKRTQSGAPVGTVTPLWIDDSSTFCRNAVG